ncbi:BREX-1 system adenine-specific DNA-methyltransferase PglX [Microbacterium sp.]|uniref:BREX-1 system adenine-specific DNA-methyltransferase PglX n=1 Tax=Microbacterium sp. TaxID=51671 RepID=UPI003A92F31F
MDTKPLESFAKAARRELIAAVSAQASAVLAPGSVARTERAETVRRLETEIAAHSHEHVIDKVAYTWFNRLIALRFMDAKGYTGAGIVSPAQAQVHGQPEILADAKRGDIDADVVTSSATRGAILGLLDGSRRSTDAEGEAYALLLTEYCRYWHKAMPFMFEREGDYTELLVPAGLLADGGIVARARNVLTEEVCDDVEVIGWLYQFYISERKDEVFAGFKKNKKAGAEEIPAATQLFTPHWIVRYLVENSVGRLWMLNKPASRLVDLMEYYIAPADEEADFLKLSGPEELTVIDPACGSGHMLTYAFDLLYEIYEEEGYAPSEIPSLILTHNLHGTEIDPRAGALAAFALTMKARLKDRRFFARDIEPKICVIEPISFAPDELDFLVTTAGDRHAEESFWNQFRDADTLGSLISPDVAMVVEASAEIEARRSEEETLYGATLARARKVAWQASILGRKYSIVTANPPYMGNKNMDARLAEYAKSNFPRSKSDLFSMFVERCLDLLPLGGYVGLMTPFVWMFITSYEALRQRVILRETITTLVQLEYSGFDGATVPICAYVLRHGRSDEIGAFVRLSDFVGPALQGPTALEIIRADRSTRLGELNSEMARHMYRVSTAEFAKVPGTPIVYWLDEQLVDSFSEDSLAASLESGGRLKTHNDARYVRYVWEVSVDRIGDTWRHLSHGGEYRRWYGNRFRVVRWKPADRAEYASHGGLHNERYWERPGITASKITSSTNSFRIKGDDQEYSSLAPTIFAKGDQRTELLRALGILNSSVTQQILWVLNPTMTLNVGDILRVPALERADIDLVAVESLISISRRDWNAFEISDEFQCSPLILKSDNRKVLADSYAELRQEWRTWVDEAQRLETQINREISRAYDLRGGEDLIEVPEQAISLSGNPAYRYRDSRKGLPAEEDALRADTVCDLISYAVGCMFGRYSLDQPGLILADQGSTLQDYLARVPRPTFRPDVDNVIPFVDDGWFEDDIVERFRQFLRAAFGAEHFEENLRFVEESLGVKTLRDYFMTKSGKSKFYDDHVQRYKKRPIYWMFSSPRGSFNALICLHRYTPSTVSTVLNEYLREYEAKLTVALQQAESSAVAGGSAKDQKEADRLRKVLAELRDYEHDVLYPLATQQISIDLDDGVKVNYPKFYPAVKRITGLEASDG